MSLQNWQLSAYLLYKEVAWSLFEFIFIFYILYFEQVPHASWLLLIPFLHLTIALLVQAKKSYFSHFFSWISLLFLGTFPFSILWILSPGSLWFLTMSVISSLLFVCLLFLLLQNAKRLSLFQDRFFFKLTFRTLCSALAYLFLIPIILILYHFYEFSHNGVGLSVSHGMSLLARVPPIIIYTLSVVPFYCMILFFSLAYHLKQSFLLSTNK